MEKTIKALYDLVVEELNRKEGARKERIGLFTSLAYGLFRQVFSKEALLTFPGGEVVDLGCDGHKGRHLYVVFVRCCSRHYHNFCVLFRTVDWVAKDMKVACTDEMSERYDRHIACGCDSLWQGEQHWERLKQECLARGVKYYHHCHQEEGYFGTEEERLADPEPIDPDRFLHFFPLARQADEEKERSDK